MIMVSVSDCDSQIISGGDLTGNIMILDDDRDTSIRTSVSSLPSGALFDIVVNALSEQYPYREIEQIKGKIWVDKVERFNVTNNLLYNLLQLCNALRNEV